MSLLIDTSVLIELERNGPSATFRPVFDRDQVSISAITVSEMLVGVELSPVEKKIPRGAIIEQMLARLNCIPIDRQIARVHSVLRADLISRGESVGIQDEWIAATALTIGSTVVTLNRKDFDRIPGLQVVSPND